MKHSLTQKSIMKLGKLKLDRLGVRRANYVGTNRLKLFFQVTFVKNRKIFTDHIVNRVDEDEMHLATD